jgi:hypothetical protein
MRTAGTILGIALAAALGACAHHQAQGGAQAAQPGGATAAACPMAQLRGVHATTADIKDGVAITFTAPESERDRIRENVKAMIEANDKRGDAFAACPCAAAGALGAAEAMPGEKGERGQTAMQPGTGTLTTVTVMPRADAKEEDISTGAILRLTAKDGSQVTALRKAARNDVHAFKKTCVSVRAPTEEPGEQK